MALRLTIGFSDNPRVEPLKDGTVKPQNIELGFVTLDPSTLFQRNLFYDEFDVSEMSISETCWPANGQMERSGTGRLCRCF